MMNVFDRVESEVRSYCRAFPAVFAQARGPWLIDENGRQYIDFFAGAGTLNYGHNNPTIKQAVLDYLQQDGVVHSLDRWTTAKRQFLETFESVILQPRQLDYKIQFTGPTGANAVEAALKLARKVKNRSNVIAFTNGYHGLSAGALALTGNRHFRNEAFINRIDVAFMPYDGYFGPNVNTLDYLRQFLQDSSSGVDLPAAIVVETVQAEGGVRVARTEWLQGLERLCREFDILLLIDDIQVGNGRTGAFFSFECAGLRPDMVTLSKSIGGIGLPMSLLLIDRQIDLWKPAEHTGTFRGHNLAFVASTAALSYWRTEDFARDVQRKGNLLVQRLTDIQHKYPQLELQIRSRGFICGLAFRAPEVAKAVAQEAFQRGLIIELAGSQDEVLKFLPPLVIEEDVLLQGVDIIDQSIAQALKLSRG